jgi:hypothetical protein
MTKELLDRAAAVPTDVRFFLNELKLHLIITCSIQYVLTKNFLSKLAIDLLNPSFEQEKQTYKLKRLVQSPDTYFMDVKCPGKSLTIPVVAS